MSKKKDYEIGHRKPPQNTRYKKGQSGNPAGRPKGSLNLGTILDNVLSRDVTMTDAGGHKRDMSLLEGLIMKQANLAATDPRAFKAIMQLYKDTKGKDMGTKEPLPWGDDDPL